MSENPSDTIANEELSHETEAMQQNLYDSLLEAIHAEIARIRQQQNLTREQAMGVLKNRLKGQSKPQIGLEYKKLVYTTRQGKSEQKRAIIEALTPNEKGELELASSHLYIDYEYWTDVSEDPAYREAKKDLELIKQNITEIIRILGYKGVESLTLSEFGPGDGLKIRQIIVNKILDGIRKERLKLGEKPLTNVNLSIIDTNPELVQIAILSILNDIIEQIKLNKNRHLNKNHPWKSLIDFINAHDLDLNKGTGFLMIILRDSFFKMMNGTLKWHNGNPVEHYIQYAFARYFGFEIYNDELLKKYLNDVELPINMSPVNINFEDVDYSQFHATNDNAQCILHLGDEICNGFIEDKIAESYPELCGEAVPIDEEAHRQNPDDENNVRATYIAFSFQTSHFDTAGLSPEELSPDREKILSAYNNHYFNKFVTHLFEGPKLSEFYDPKTGEDYLIHTDCYDLEADFYEDPDHPGYYGSFHHIVFNRDVNITVTVDEETQTFEMKKGQKVRLLSSYKPTAAQVKAACEKQNLKVVRIYQDSEETNAVFVIRKMTEYEQSLNEKLAA